MKIRKRNSTALVAASAKPILRPSKALLDAICRNDFPSFTRKCFHSLSPGSRFLTSWHMSALAYRLEQVRLGEITRLIINMPPRYGKSTAASAQKRLSAVPKTSS